MDGRDIFETNTCTHTIRKIVLSNLVLEFVTLNLEVKVVIKVLVDLLGISVTLEEATQNTDASHPENLAAKTGLTGTTTLTDASVTTLPDSVELRKFW